MRASKLSSLLHTEHQFFSGSDPEITEITNDSRQVIPGSIYVALSGEHVDGHAFIPEAIERGAVALMCTTSPGEIPSGIAVFQTSQARLSLSEASHYLFGSPSDSLTVIGVTGTDGKTTTCSFIHQVLNSLGIRTGLLSSALIDYGTGEEANLLHQSTPEAPQVHRALRQMIKSGVTHVVIESTSHGLSTKTCRLAHVRYDAAILTNMGPEHLEFHGTFEQYRHDKANLFRALDYGYYAAAGPIAREDGLPYNSTLAGNRESFAVLNQDDPVAPYFERATQSTIRTFSMNRSADYTATVDARADGSAISINTPSGIIRTSLGIPGEFNVANLLAAVAVVQEITDVSAGKIAASVSGIQPVSGRMMVVQRAPFTVIVDFAHTPGAFSRVLPFFRKSTTGKLIVVFGSAGERDVGKRLLQGEQADRHADIVFLTDEDPRGEDRMEIIEQIATGFSRLERGDSLHLVPERREAIRRALLAADTNDTVLLLGKGHETSIIGSSGAVSWNEFEVARDLLEKIRNAQ